MSNFWRTFCVRGLVFVLTLSIVGTTVYAPLTAPTPKKAHALVFVDPANLTQNTVQAATSVHQSIVSTILNGLAWTLAKMTIQSLTRSVVNWINSGFQGSPAFVSDLNQNLKYLGDAIANNFFQNLNQVVYDNTGFNITSPFQDQIAQKLRTAYFKGTSNALGFNYTLYQTSRDPKAFLNGDFSKGGYDAYFSASQNPANNPFGAYLLASNQLWSSIDYEKQNRKAELDWGRGFLSFRGNCAVATPTQGPRQSQSAALSGAAKGGSGASANESANANLTSTQAVSLSKAEKCPFNSIKTPGAVIETSLGITATSPLRQLELADSINEIVAALMGQLINQVLGAAGLSGVSQPSSGGGASYLDQATSNSQYDAVNASLATGVTQNVANDQTGVETYRNNWQSILDAADAAKTRCGEQDTITSTINTATSNITRANTAITEIGQIKADVQDAAQTTAVDKSLRITTAISNYQSYLSSPTIPSASEQADAAFQSTDTSNATSTPPSLFTQMTSLQKSCNSSS